MKKIAIINGVNLNFLGKREPHLYGNITLTEIEQKLLTEYSSIAMLVTYQSNIEGEIVSYIQSLYEQNITGIVINPGAYTHTSIAIRDALLSVSIPFIEVHLTNIYTREKFRHKSYLSDIATSVISGCGSRGYFYAIDYILEQFD